MRFEEWSEIFTKSEECDFVNDAAEAAAVAKDLLRGVVYRLHCWRGGVAALGGERKKKSWKYRKKRMKETHHNTKIKRCIPARRTGGWGTSWREWPTQQGLPLSQWSGLGAGRRSLTLDICGVWDRVCTGQGCESVCRVDRWPRGRAEWEVWEMREREREVRERERRGKGKKTKMPMK